MGAFRSTFLSLASLTLVLSLPIMDFTAEQKFPSRCKTGSSDAITGCNMDVYAVADQR